MSKTAYWIQVPARLSRIYAPNVQKIICGECGQQLKPDELITVRLQVNTADKTKVVGIQHESCPTKYNVSEI